MITKEAIRGLFIGEPTLFLIQYGQIWKNQSDRIMALWRQPDTNLKLKAFGDALVIALLFLGSLLLLVWFIFPVIIFGAFIKAIRVSMGKQSPKK